MRNLLIDLILLNVSLSNYFEIVVDLRGYDLVIIVEMVVIAFLNYQIL